MKMKNCKFAVAALLATGSSLPLGAFYLPDSILVDVDLAWQTEYVFRGVKEAGTTVQPNVTISHIVSDRTQVAFDFWAALPARSGEDSNEFNYQLNVVSALTDQFSLDYGGILYYFPAREVDGDGKGLWEGFVTLEFRPSPDGNVAYSLSYHRYLSGSAGLQDDFNFVEGSVDLYDISFAGGSLSLGASLGTAFPDKGTDGGEYRYYSLRSSLAYQLREGGALTASVGVDFTGYFDGDVGNGGPRDRHHLPVTFSIGGSW